MKLQPGDYVQWESHGTLQFSAPQPIREFSPDGAYAFFDSSSTGVPVDQLLTADPLADKSGSAPSGHSNPSSRIPPNWGAPLDGSDYVNLAASWITPEMADQAMLRRVDAEQGRAVTGQKGKRNCSGVLIPYYLPGNPAPVNFRVRRDHPEWTTDIVRDHASEPRCSAPILIRRLKVRCSNLIRGGIDR
jgi:hypothetical protein